MPVYLARKTVISPSGGVNYSKKPHLLSPIEWYKLTQLRSRLGIITGFPGWNSILASGNAGGVGSLLTEYFKKDGTYFIVVGGPTKLFSYDSGAQTLTDISGAVSFTPTADFPWHAITWNDIIYMANRFNVIHKWNGTGNVSAIFPGPQGWSINVIKNHLALFGVDSNPFTFQWFAEGTETFTPSATNDAGQFDVLETDDHAVGLYGLHEDLVGYKNESIHLFTYIGGRQVIGRRTAITDVGLLGPYAIAVFNDQHIFMGARSFYKYTGGNVVDDSIGDAIREEVYPNLHPLYKGRSRSLILNDTHEIMFAYPDKVSVGHANRCVIFNYKENTWSGPFNIDATMMGFGRVSEEIVIDDLSMMIDDIDTLIDQLGQGEKQQFYMFMKTDGDIMRIDGSMSDEAVAITREGETGDVFLGKDAEYPDGSSASFPLSTVFLLSQVSIEFLNVSSATVQMYVGSRMDLGDNITWAGPFNLASNSAHTIPIPVRSYGRWFRLRFVLPDSGDMALAGYQFHFAPVGVR